MRVPLPLLAFVALSMSQCKEAKPPVRNPLPGGMMREAALAAQLSKALTEKGEEYEPRTHHKDEAGRPKYSNRLLLETSPYLLQHAHNPVDWFPWGDEAFEMAKKLGRPVLISIGYSTCHWCHVMERESFEDEETAKYLNENYIAIKVDREERPDVDAIYMAAVHALGIGGGWPLNVWLTPDGEPFFGGTYFPPSGRGGGRPSFISVLEQQKSLFETDPGKVAEKARMLANRIDVNTSYMASPDLPGKDVFKKTFEHFQSRFDSQYGGARSRRSKFPSNFPNRWLLRFQATTKEKAALDMVALTLEKMAQGGIHDHVGGGFHRYSTDPRWLVPHFEKMLYDNALLAMDYLDSSVATGREDFLATAEETLGYIMREMSSPEGGFYSATDADSITPAGHRDEGYFFTWTPGEVKKLLGETDAAFINAYFDITERGNFEGRSIPNTPRPMGDVAADLKVSDAKAVFIRSRAKMYEERSSRPSPLLDDKILAAWNGLTISALSKAAFAQGPKGKTYLDRAEVAAHFVTEKMRVNGRLQRTYRKGVAKIAAYLEDYAFVIAGLLDLYEASGNKRWLGLAIELQDQQNQYYQDEEKGGFFQTASDGKKLLTRLKPDVDGAIPSGNSIAAMNLLRLFEFTSKEKYQTLADGVFRSVGAVLSKHGASFGVLLEALDFRLGEPKEIVLVFGANQAEADAFREVLGKTHLPNKVVVPVNGAAVSDLVSLVPLVEHKVARNGKTTAYVCVRGSCKLPTTDVGVFRKQLTEPPR